MIRWWWVMSGFGARAVQGHVEPASTPEPPPLFDRVARAIFDPLRRMPTRTSAVAVWVAAIDAWCDGERGIAGMAM